MSETNRLVQIIPFILHESLPIAKSHPFAFSFQHAQFRIPISQNDGHMIIFASCKRSLQFPEKIFALEQNDIHSVGFIPELFLRNPDVFPKFRCL